MDGEYELYGGRSVVEGLGVMRVREDVLGTGVELSLRARGVLGEEWLVAPARRFLCAERLEVVCETALEDSEVAVETDVSLARGAPNAEVGTKFEVREGD